MKHIHEFKNKNVSWTNITKPSVTHAKYLADKYGILADDAAEVLPPIQRSKLVERPDYLFMILLFPVYDRETKEINTEEVDFFITRDCLITIHSNQIPVLKDIFADCAENQGARPCADGVASLAYAVLDGLFNYCFPIMRHLNLDLEMVEKIIFKKYEMKETVDTILRVKTNIFDVQRIMQSHEYVLNKLIEKTPRFFPAKEFENNFLRPVEHAREIMLLLQSFKDEINALHEANTTLVEYRVNEILKVLTIFSVIVFPLTLLAAVFGMNVEEMPIVGANYGFWKIVGVMAGGAITMLGFFKWKKWI